MSKGSDRVKKWRKETKKRIVASMGGKCQCCGYDRCVESLDFHHIDPSEKELAFGKIRASPKKWESICNELRKCILVCSNCHREIHCGLIKVPENYQKFNEDFVDYKKFEIEQTPCLTCGTMKSFKKKYCDNKFCIPKPKWKKINWDNIDLLNEIKSKSILCISNELGVSWKAVKNRIKKLQSKGNAVI